jgi:hypothetical protein
MITASYEPKLWRVRRYQPADMIFIAEAARGNGRNTLWEKLKRDHANGYIIGAGCLDAAHADKSIQDSGLVFSKCYTVYDIRSVPVPGVSE